MSLKKLFIILALTVNAQAFTAFALPPLSPSAESNARFAAECKHANNLYNQGTTPTLVLLLEYKDVKFNTPDPAVFFHYLLNGKKFNEYGASGSVSKYFKEQSDGLYEPWFDVFGPFTLSQNRSYYGTNNSSDRDKAPEDMVVHGVKLLGDIDLSVYDTNHDGVIDNILIIYAGEGEASFGPSTSIWPHSGSLSMANKSVSKGGYVFDSYTCVNEWEETTPVGPGQIIYELCRAMGLPDMGSTADWGAKFTPATWSVMDRGCYTNGGMTPPGLSAFERAYLGWHSPIEISGNDLISLRPLSDGGTAYMMRTEKENEFFIFENRQPIGFDAALPGHGMLIWHIDYNNDAFENNAVNVLEHHQYVDIVEACGTANSWNLETLEAYPWPGPTGKTEFSAETAPAFVSWDGRPMPYPISDIHETENGEIIFKVGKGLIALEAPGDFKCEPLAAGNVSLSWTPVENAESYRLRIYRHSDTPNDLLEDSLEFETTTSYTHLIVDSLEDGQIYAASLFAESGSSQGPEALATFELPSMTWAHRAPIVPISTEFENGSFIASWEEMDGATEYLLTVYSDNFIDHSETVDFGHRSTTSVEVPSQWQWSGGSRDLYLQNSVGMYATSAPALKFNSDNTLLSPEYPHAIASIQFWYNSSSNVERDDFTVDVFRAECGEWHTVFEDSPTYSDDGYRVALERLPVDATRVRFSFKKITGNLALDDIRVQSVESAPEIFGEWEEKSVGFVHSCEITIEQPLAKSYLFGVHALNDSGEKSAMSDLCRVDVPATVGIVPPLVSGSDIRVHGLEIECVTEPRSTVRLIDLAGRLLKQTTADSTGRASLQAPSKGLYLIVAHDGATLLKL